MVCPENEHFQRFLNWLRSELEAVNLLGMQGNENKQNAIKLDPLSLSTLCNLCCRFVPLVKRQSQK